VIIADTNVVSEFMKEQPDPRVLSWARTLESSELTICVVTVEEVERGLGCLPRGRRRTDLTHRWVTLLDAFAEAIAVYDLAAARATADLVVDAEDDGRTMSLADAQTAGVCLSRRAVLATRNVTDFAGVNDLTVVNPFDHEPGRQGG
jgi:toxin FitB